MTRIVVFSGDLSFAVRKGIVEIDRRISGIEWLLVLHSAPRTLRRLLRNQLINLRRHGWRWIFYQGREICGRILHRTGEDDPRPIGSDGPKIPGHEYSSKQLLTMPNVRCFKTSD